MYSFFAVCLLPALWFCPYFLLNSIFKCIEKIVNHEEYKKERTQAVVTLTIVSVLLSFFILE